MRAARIPPELTQGVFTTAQAQAHGLTRRQLAGQSWRQLGRGIYVWRGLADTPEVQLDAALHRLSPLAVFSGRAAAWLHGLDVEPGPAVEVTVPHGQGIVVRAGMSIRRQWLEPDDIVTIRGYRTTSIARTLCDLSRRLSLTEEVVLLDAALHANLLDEASLRAWMAARRGTTGIVALRRAVGFVEPLAESPMETRLRMLLVLAGLPCPLAQVTITEANGSTAGRLDLYYPEQRLGLEYDGAGHRESLVEDNRRQNRLLRLGIRLLRFTADDMQHRRAAIVSEVTGELRRRAA